MTIEIIKEAKDRLSQKVFRFWVVTDYSKDGLNMSLDSYFEQSRKTTRHKYTTDKKWSRTDKRYNDFDNDALIERMPEGIIPEAKEKLIQAVKHILVKID